MQPRQGLCLVLCINTMHVASFPVFEDFDSKNKFQNSLLLTNIKFDQKICSCLLIFDQNFREDNFNLCFFSKKFAITAILKSKPLK